MVNKSDNSKIALEVGYGSKGKEPVLQTMKKKKDKFRIYYLIYEEIKAVYLVGLSEKKDQQKIINTIWLFKKTSPTRSGCSL
ncbi:MAG: hypothetical protein AABX13_00815 [Nanoarchaeota archaeon]